MEALGMIETIGTIAAIEAGDAMVKSADVSIVSKEFVGGGIVTVIVEGDVMAVKTAVDAGAASVKRLADDALLTEHVIPRPDSQLELIVNKPQIIEVEVEEAIIEQVSPNEIVEEIDLIEVESVTDEEDKVETESEEVIVQETIEEKVDPIKIDSVTVEERELTQDEEVEPSKNGENHSSEDQKETKISNSEAVVYTKKQLNSLTVSKLKDIIRKDKDLTLPTKKMSKKELIQMILNK